MSDIYKAAITQIFEDRTRKDKSEFALYKKQLIEYGQKIEKARNILLSGGLDAANYRLVKNDCERQISILEGKLLNSSKSNQGIGPLLNRALRNYQGYRNCIIWLMAGAKGNY